MRKSIKVRYKSIKKRDLYSNTDLVEELRNMSFTNGALRPALNDKHIKKVWVAFHRNRPIGWCGLYYEDGYRKTGNELGVYVKQRYRGRGIGRKLLYMGCKGLRKYSWYNRKENSGWVDQDSRPQIELNRKRKKVEKTSTPDYSYNNRVNDYNYYDYSYYW